jgi:hypothetical protein
MGLVDEARDLHVGRAILLRHPPSFQRRSEQLERDKNKKRLKSWPVLRKRMFPCPDPQFLNLYCQ